MEGWNESKVYDILQVCEKLNELEYELKNCIRGCYTNCNTYEELGQYVRQLAEELESAGVCTQYEQEDPAEEDDDILA